MSIAWPVFGVDRTPESVLVAPYVTTIGAAFNVNDGGAAATGAAHIAASRKIGTAFLIERTPFARSEENSPFSGKFMRRGMTGRCERLLPGEPAGSGAQSPHGSKPTDGRWSRQGVPTVTCLAPTRHGLSSSGQPRRSAASTYSSTALPTVLSRGTSSTSASSIGTSRLARPREAVS